MIYPSKYIFQLELEVYGSNHCTQECGWGQSQCVWGFEASLFPIINSWHPCLCRHILSQKSPRRKHTSNYGTFPNKIWLDLDWIQPSFFIFTHIEREVLTMKIRRNIEKPFTICPLDPLTTILRWLYLSSVERQKEECVTFTFSIVMPYVGPGELSHDYRSSPVSKFDS